MTLRNFRLINLALAVALLSSPSAQPQTPSEAQALEARGDWKGAEQAWRAVLKQSPKDYRVWASLGIVLSQEHRYEEAVKVYRGALALSPGDGQTQLNLGLAYFKMGRLADAAKPFEAAAKSLGNSPRLDVLLGFSLYGAEHYREAIPYLERASSEQPGNAELERTLGQTYLHTGAYDKAMSAFQKILIGSPDSAQAHMLLGQAYDAGNHEEAAIAEFRSAIQGPYVPNAHFGLGYLLWKAHRYDDAAVQFQKELDEDPRNSQALAYLGDVMLKQRDQAKAFALLQRSVALRADNHLAFVDLAIIEMDRKQYEAAEQHLKHAVILNSKEADAHYRLARLYQVTGHARQAAREFGLVKQVEKNNTEDLVFKVSRDAQTSPTPAEPPATLRY